MTAPQGSSKPRSRLGVAILAGGLVLVIALVAASGVAVVVGSDDSDSDATDPARSQPTEPAEAPPDADPATVELRRVLDVIERRVDCRKPDVWCAASGPQRYRLGPVELGTNDIMNAEARLSEYGQFVVGITLSEAGATKFEEVTRELGRNSGVTAQLAIVVDDLVVTAPTVQGPIPGGELDIAAEYTQQQAERLAAALDP